MPEVGRVKKKEESASFDPFKYLPSNKYSTIDIFKKFESLKSWKLLDKQIDKFFEEKFLPSLEEFDIIVTIDRKATTILKVKRKKYPKLYSIDILKSSYIGEKEKYHKKRVAIFDDSIKSGRHSIDTVLAVADDASYMKIFCIACLKDGEKNVKREVKKVRPDVEIEIEKQIAYEDEEKFQAEFGKAICAYMLHLQIPSDKDHFYVECGIRWKKETGTKKRISYLDFIELFRKMDVEPFIVDSDEWNYDRIKISSHFEKLDKVEDIHPIFSFRRGIKFKMRIFLRLDENIVFLVPISMDLIIMKSLKQKIRLLMLKEKCDMDVKLCGHKERKTVDSELERYICEECIHLNLKLRFLEYFLHQFDDVLSEKEFMISLLSTRWDKVEGNYPIEIHKLVTKMVNGLDNIYSEIKPDHDPALI